MPGWTITDWSNHPDWTAIANGQELYTAYSQRRQAIGMTAATIPAIGDDAQSFIYEIQSWVYGYASYFLQSHSTDGTYLGDSYFHGRSNLDNFGGSNLNWTNENVFKACGLWKDSSHYGFRRCTTWPTDWTNYNDAAFSLGAAQAGDLIGPWIFVDLQAVFNKLVWYYNGAPAIADCANKYFAATAATYAALLVAVSNGWAGIAWGSYDSGQNMSKAEYFISSGGSYAAQVWVVRSKFCTTVPSFGISPAVDWYVRADRPYWFYCSPWQTPATAVSNYDITHFAGLDGEFNWSKIATSSGSGTVIGNWIHDNGGLPAAPPDPALCGVGWTYQGFTTLDNGGTPQYLNNRRAIVRWNVAGGFTQW